jgi:hypothetical protein
MEADVEDTEKTLHDRRVKDLTFNHALLAGKAFDELNEDELQILYAWELWDDGMDIDQIFEDMNYSDKPKLSKEYIVLQLKSVFGYTFKTIIEGE